MKASWRQAVVYWAPSFTWMVLIFYLSSYPTPEVFKLFDFRFIFFKFLHLVEYGILGALVYGSLRKTTGASRGLVIALTVFLTTLYGVTDEIHQLFVVGRSAHPLDVVTDGVGALIATLVVHRNKKAKDAS